MDRSVKQRAVEHLTRSGYLPMLEAWAKASCAPVLFRNAETSRPHNGSMTFIDTGAVVLGVTAAHVATAVRDNCSDRQGFGCAVGAAELDPSWLISIHPSLDLASYRLSDQFVATARHSSATVSAWPPAWVGDRALVLYCGYPGIYREERTDSIDWAFVWFVSVVESASARQAGTVLRIADSLTAGAERVPPNADLGGMSGGPVFRILEDAAVIRLELAGIIHEYSESTEIILAHPLTSLRPDGTWADQ